MHTIAFRIAFTLIIAAHLVIGEQAPKIFTIREPKKMVLWCALPLRLFYVISYPLLILLSATTDTPLKVFGLKNVSEYDAPHW